MLFLPDKEIDEHELLNVAVCKLFRKQRIYKMSFLGGLKEMSKSLKNNKVYLIVLVATMAAMAIALEKIGSLKVTPSIKITFYAVPLMVVGMLHGPKLGALAGLVSGIVIQLTSEYGINLSSIFFGLAPVVWGFVSGLIFKLVGKLSMFQEGDDFRSNGCTNPPRSTALPAGSSTGRSPCPICSSSQGRTC